MALSAFAPSKPVELFDRSPCSGLARSDRGLVPEDGTQSGLD